MRTFYLKVLRQILTNQYAMLKWMQSNNSGGYSNAILNNKMDTTLNIISEIDDKKEPDQQG